ncbi:DUF1802 domain-containing protein [Nostoc sp. 'Peltigera membranacea cyanobiont' 210A]|uniref:DUF1802 family protein n=1 Tax=Nostoc sp. 'Peltigera membranacea cyanobiont' 210A TaxID=2014529 RepID=UPI000B95A5E8|nr:DUF1802 family protein [Nostoc sp. 'Peltigera membranacea cyanobiont' 210A]OYD94448.1 DUF1802 domain-containing protein [Nostoc sp. 'Peltigera membranacea cyanobiont' 210A]
MNQQFSIPTALCLPVPDIEALIQGRTIVALPKMFIRPGQRFALYPADSSASIKAWAKCELCQILDETKPLEILSKLTIWTPKVLKEILQKQQYLFLAYLRVYQLPQLQEISVNPKIQEKLGKFVSLPNSLTVSEVNPVMTDRTFTQRKRQLEKLEPSLHPELEELQSAIASLTISQPAAKQLDDDIKVFLGWSSDKLIKQPAPNLAWINNIVKLGDRSIELDEGKNNYQAGTDFEIIARRSLDFLGFKVEENYKGGAGGLDLFCSQPYPLVCECKAGKSIPDRAVEELDRIGKRHLKENYLQAVRLIIGPGKPTKNLKESAEISKISIINVMTLQKLVEFKAKYPGAINLVELQQYLEPGQVDYKIGEYIDKAEREIKLRSHIIQLVKNYLENSGIESAGVESLHGAYFGSNPPQPIKTPEMHEILIELSSPLTGYLGRIKGSDWKSDRFYFLRDLPIN